MNKVVFCQPSTDLVRPDNPCLDYYRKVYPMNEGYHMGRYFMEVPTWIAIISGMLPDEHYEKELHVIQDVQHTIKYLKYMNENTIVMFSVLDVNKHIIQEIIKSIPQVKVCGGYVHPDEVSDWCIWIEHTYQLADYLPHVQVNAPPNYDLFKGWMKSIPRISLSEGCLHNCAFCSIPKELNECTFDQVYDQAMSFKGLEFELVYVNDKTYGQACNWSWLASIYDMIKEYNPTFQGFIVQTTVPMALKHVDTWVKYHHVKYVEVGVEAVDEEYLKSMRKPYNLEQLRLLTLKLRHEHVKVGFIPNIIFGLPDARYENTLAWLWLNADLISFINPYVLCQYEDSKGSMVIGGGENDTNENVLEKSWLSQDEIECTEQAMKHAFSLTKGGECE